MRPVGGASETSLPLAQPRQAEAPSGAGSSFGDTLSSAVAEVDRLQVAADEQASGMARGEGNLHETMLALEKADVAMRLALKVRTKVVDAYNDVMRMTV